MEQFAQDGCKVVYLHVLATNITARRFYEKRNFRQHMIIPYYYTIGKRVDFLARKIILYLYL